VANGDINGACSNRGQCSSGITGDGTCACQSDHVGPACQYSRQTCTYRGNPDYTGICHCDSTFGGPTCADCAADHYRAANDVDCVFCTRASTCSGHGTCTRGQTLCVCDSGYAGPSCQDCTYQHYKNATGHCIKCTASNCINGECQDDGSCRCKPGFAGPQCDACAPGYFGSLCQPCNNCNNGVCLDGMAGSGLCQCNEGWAGSRCDVAADAYCHNRGTYDASSQSCTCQTGYKGRCDECQANYYRNEESCIYCSPGVTCSGKGSCSSLGACVCDSGFSGNNCEQCAPDHYAFPDCRLCDDATCQAGVCDAQGMCQCHNANIQGDSCNQCKVGWAGFDCTTECAGGATNPCHGKGTCQSGMLGSGSCACDSGFSGAACNDPQFRSHRYPDGPSTAGGATLTIMGDFLHTATIVYQSDVLRPVCDNYVYGENSFTCVLLEGQNIVVPQLVHPSGFQMTLPNIVYAKPTFLSFSPLGSPTVGGGVLTLVGYNFGVDYRLKFGANNAEQEPLPGSNHTHALFPIPPGLGSLNPQFLLVDGPKFTLMSLPQFSYDPLNITSVITQLSTAGGTLTITATNLFCAPIMRVAYGNGVTYKALDATSCSEDGMVVAYPVWMGQLTATLSSPNAFPGFSHLLRVQAPAYEPPVVDSVTGCLARGCPREGGTFITINGRNFYNDVSSLNVTIGNQYCVNLGLGVAHTRIICSTAGGVGENLDLVVRLYGPQGFRVDSQPVPFSYIGPRFVPRSLTMPSEGHSENDTYDGVAVDLAIDSSRNLDTLSTLQLVVNVESLSAVTTSYSVYLGGVPYNSNYAFICAVASRSELGGDVSQLTLTCGVSGTVGRHLSLHIIEQLPSIQYTGNAPSLDTVSFPAPHVISMSIDGTGDFQTIVNSTHTYGDRLAVLGSNFGKKPNLIQVTYSSIPYHCTVTDVVNTLIKCKASSGAGVLLPFTVTVGLNQHAVNATGTVMYSYPTAPEIVRIEGCNGTQGDGVIGCSTQGGDTITIFGTSLTAFATVQVKNQDCRGVKAVGSQSNMITCTLPAGSGTNQLVVVYQEDRFSKAAALVSYAAPQPTAVTGCINGGDTFCPRTGSVPITISGSHFGAANAKVLVGGYSCGSVTHGVNNADFHSKLVCMLPPGQGENRPVTVFQEGGQSSNAAVTLSYELCTPGTIVNITVPNTCSPCQPGFFSALSQQYSCTQCPGGTFNNLTGQSVCRSCAAGYNMSTPGQTACASCEPGQYAHLQGSLNCLSCPIGKFSGAGASTECLQCQEGKFQDETQQSICKDCEAGFVSMSKQQSQCQACDGGKFASTGGLSVCSDCPRGTNSSQGQGSSFCPECIPGKYASTTARASCTVCGFGQYTPNNSSCVACPTGFYNNQQEQSTCVGCASGRYASREGSAECANCTAGYFTSTTNRSSCDPCPAGHYSAAGASACIACVAGKYQASTSQTACLNCPAGEYSDGSAATICTKCVAGEFNPNTTKTACSKCDAGRYSTFEGSVACQPCLSGTYAPTSGLIVCANCPAGTNASSTGSSSCAVCPQGSFSSQRSSLCTACPLGKFAQFDNSSTCTECPAGSFQNIGGQSDCDLCLPGSYSSSSGAFACTRCAAGRYNTEYNRSACDPCAMGHYSIANATMCLECELGKYAPASDTSSCLVCAAGMFADNTKQESCTSCPPGKYQNSTKSSACVTCELGFVAANSGATSCTGCLPGTYSTDSLTCSACGVGVYSGVAGSSACVDCPKGTFNERQSMSICSSCPEGYFQPIEGQTNCTQCPTGRYNPSGATSRSSCLPCVAGKITEQTGSIECASCPKGRFQNTSEQTHCVECSAGSFADNTGSTACALARLGTLTSQNASISETACPAGYFSNVTGSTDCLACAPGSYQNTTGRSYCASCAAGYYTSSSASPLCYACGPGLFTNTTGMQLCLECQPGRFQGSFNQIECERCHAGRYQSNPKRESCDAASPGSYVPERGATVPTLCPAGHHQNNNSASACSKCTPGRFTASQGTVECSECDAGSYSPESGATACVVCPGGRFQQSFGSSVCEPCLINQYRPEGSGGASCLQCELGQVSLERGRLNCTACPVGTYRSQQGIDNNCTQCAPGTWIESPGASACNPTVAGRYTNGSHPPLDCHAGTFSDQERSSSCKQCIPGKYSNTGAVSCIECPSNTAAPFSGTVSCIRCSASSFSSTDRLTCICNVGLYAANANASTSEILCLPCPRGADCSESGLTIAKLNSIDGWWRADNSSLNFYRCLLPAHCAPGTATCREYRTGPICSVCVDGYRSQSGTSRCQKCPTASTSTVTTIFLFILVVIVVLFLFWLVLRSDRDLYNAMYKADLQRDEWDKFDTDLGLDAMKRKAMEKQRQEEEAAAYTSGKKYVGSQKHRMFMDNLEDVDGLNLELGKGVKKMVDTYANFNLKNSGNFVYKVKIIISFLQIVLNMAFVLDVEWPPTYTSFISFFSFINLDFIPWQSVGCVTAFTFYQRHLITFFLLPMLVTVVFLGFLLPSYRQAHKKYQDRGADAVRAAKKRVRRKFWKLLLFVMFCLYPNLSSSMLGFFVCRNINGDPFLLSDFSLRCYDGDWNAHLPWAIFGVILYPLGIPCFFLYLLIRYRRRLKEDGVRLQLGLLYAAYEESSWYFELCEMGNKLIMTGLLAFLPADLQIGGALIVCALYFGLLTVRPPYIRRSDDALHLLAQVEITLIVLAVHIMIELGSTLDSSTDIALSVLFIFLTIGMILVWLSLTVRSLWYALKSTNWEDIKTKYKNEGLRSFFANTSKPTLPSADSDLCLDVLPNEANGETEMTTLPTPSEEGQANPSVIGSSEVNGSIANSSSSNNNSADSTPRHSRGGSRNSSHVFSERLSINPLFMEAAEKDVAHGVGGMVKRASTPRLGEEDVGDIGREDTTEGETEEERRVRLEALRRHQRLKSLMDDGGAAHLDRVEEEEDEMSPSSPSSPSFVSSSAPPSPPPLSPSLSPPPPPPLLERNISDLMLPPSVSLAAPELSRNVSDSSIPPPPLSREVSDLSTSAPPPLSREVSEVVPSPPSSPPDSPALAPCLSNQHEPAAEEAKNEDEERSLILDNTSEPEVLGNEAADPGVASIDVNANGEAGSESP